MIRWPATSSEQHAGLVTGLFELEHQVGSAVVGGLLDARVEVEAVVEVEIDQVVTADHAVERDGFTMDIDPFQPRDITGGGFEVFGDGLEIGQFVGEGFEVILEVFVS